MWWKRVLFNIEVTNYTFFLDLRDEFERYPGGLSVLLGTPALLPCTPPVGYPTPTLRYKNIQVGFKNLDKNLTSLYTINESFENVKKYKYKGFNYKRGR